MPSIVTKFQHEGWESSYTVPYTKNIIAFGCQHINDAIFDFEVWNHTAVTRTKNPGTTSTKQKHILNMEQSNSDGAASDMSGTNNRDDLTVQTNERRKTGNAT